MLKIIGKKGGRRLGGATIPGWLENERFNIRKTKNYFTEGKIFGISFRKINKRGCDTQHFSASYIYNIIHNILGRNIIISVPSF